MNALDLNSPQRRFIESMLAILRPIGYDDELVARGYEYRDRFTPKHPERQIGAALFGRTPVSYETALIGIVEANGSRGGALVNEHRSLGAPLVLEVQDETIGIWAVGRNKELTSQIFRFNRNEFRNWVDTHADQLQPREFLRTKELNSNNTFFQSSLFAGLIPELEEEIGKSLDPLLRLTFNAGVKAYERATGTLPLEADLFKLAFSLLAGKVFADRRHPDFLDLTAYADPDEVISRVATHYQEEIRPLLNRAARETIFDHIWKTMDFRNLSVEVLSQIWSRTLVTDETRKRLGIHRTRRSLVRYIVDHIPFEDFAPADRRVLELCSGSAAFLIGALDRMRDMSEIGDPLVRHAYFQEMLRGIEKDPFGVEIGRLCLALADYPNPNGWRIKEGDVFDPKSLTTALRETSIILCNPPFEKYSEAEKSKYEASFWTQPAELVSRVLDGLRRPDVALGFVLPRSFLDGQDYREVRARLAGRFGTVDLVSLPDRGWDQVAPETVLLVASGAGKGGRISITQGVVREQNWRAFEWYHEVASRDTDAKSVEEARESFVVPELRDVWEFLDYCPKIGDIAEAHKGIRWNVPLESHEHLLVRDEEFPESHLGVPPRSKILSFEIPRLKYLNFDAKYRLYSAFDRPWDRPKVFVNKTRRSRDTWRAAAFADFDGLVCSETFYPIWPNEPELTTPLEAVLNGPVANAFLTTHCGRREFPIRSMLSIPFPILSKNDIDEICSLVTAYKEAVSDDSFPISGHARADRLLRQIDAVVLDAYRLPPRLERKLLDFFNGGKRLVPFSFSDYFPAEFTPCFPLKEWLTGRPALSTVDRFRSQSRDLPEHIQRALEVAGNREGEEEE